jgi:hypothetical protein
MLFVMSCPTFDTMSSAESVIDSRAVMDDEPSADPPAVGRRSRWRRTGLVAVLSVVGTLIAVHLLLFASTSDQAHCAKPVHINSSMSYMLNCDSVGFMVLAHYPETILGPHDVRQSRPGYVALGFVATRLLGSAAESSGLAHWYHAFDSAYLPLVLINYVALAAAVGLIAALLLDLGVPRLGVVALCAVLLVNDLTKPFFWTPHQQMFALLTPLLTVVIVRWVMRRVVTRAEMTLLGLGLGAGMLLYGNVVVTVVAVAAVLLLRGVRGARGSRWPAVRRNVTLVALFGVAFATPPLLWMELCRRVAGSYYSHEMVAYHQFVWLPEAAHVGPSVLLRTVVHFARATVDEIIAGAGVLLIVLVVAAVLALKLGSSVVSAAPRPRATLAATVLTFVCSVLFCWALGYYAPRMAFNVVPVLLLLIGWFAARLAARSPAMARAVAVAMPVLAAVWVGYELVKPGPYS